MAGEFPAAVTQLVQYGLRLTAVAAYLQSYQFLSYARTTEALFGVRWSKGILVNAQATAYAVLQPVKQAMAADVQQVDVGHVDKTGQRVAGQLERFHTLSISGQQGNLPSACWRSQSDADSGVHGH